MLNSLIISKHFPTSKLKYLSKCLLNKRWTTTAAVGFNDEELASAKPFKELPSHLSLPLVGTTWVYLPVIGRYDFKLLNESFLKKRRIFGDIFRDKFGSQNVVISFSPDDLETMYKHEGIYPSRNALLSLKSYRELRKDWFKTLGVILLIRSVTYWSIIREGCTFYLRPLPPIEKFLFAPLNGTEWHDLRRKTQKHLMKPRAIQAFLDPMQDVARDFVKKIFQIRDSNKEVPGFHEELYKWALESVSLVGLDTRLGCLAINLPDDSEAMKMIKNVQTAFECISKLEAFSGRVQLWKYISTPTWKKYVEASDAFTEITFKHINRSMEKLKNKTDEDADLTLIQSLIMEKGMDSSSAMVVVSDMIMAGIDTTSNTMGFFLYQMAKHPDVQEKLYQDLRKILPQKEDRINPSIFNELRYLKACLKESQRLDPIVSVHMRMLDHDVIFSGYRIPAQTLLMIYVEGIYKDEKYFYRPNEFLPERWLNKDEKIHPYAFLPFGFGVRSCIGRRLAELEIISLATEIIRKFKIEYHYEDIGKFSRLINVPDKPLKFTFIER